MQTKQEPSMKEPSTKEPSRTEIWKMFDAISPTYDKVNRAMTMGMDLYWRKKMASLLPQDEDISLLDCATGTADQIISLMEHSSSISQAVGIDLSTDMLQLGIEKLKTKPYRNKVMLQKASALEIPFADYSFDCVTMSFGIRNVTNVSVCLQEIFRVLRPGGRVLILESSLPQNKLLQKFHLLYLRKILPHIGGWISEQKQAYVYLNQTIETFPYGEAFCHLLEIHRFVDVKMHPMAFGSVSIYQADKPL